MMIIKLFRFILGYLDIEATGEFCERLLNLFALNKISVWNINRSSDKLLTTIKVKDFKKIRKIRGRSGIKVKVIKRHGLPFILNKNRYRYGFACGIVLFFAIIYILNLFVWQVRIEGNSLVDSEEILTACEEVGLKKGILKNRIESYTLRDKLLLKCSSLAWASVNVEGSVVTVNVSEIKNQNVKNDYCNVVSDYNAVIKSVIVYKGSAAVEKGDAVSKGDLLISGVVDVAGKTHFTSATGEIVAEIEEKIPIEVELIGKHKNYIGNGYSKYAVDFFGLKLPLYLGGENRSYDCESSTTPLMLFDSEMPIAFYKLKLFPYAISTYVKNEQQIESEVDVLFKDIIQKRDITDIDIISVATQNTETHYKAVFTVKYQKNIGVEEKILF